MKVITARIGEKDFEDLKKIEREEKRDRAEVMRRLLASAIKEWKIEKALELVRERKATIRKAAGLADVSYAEMLELASKANIESGYDLRELKKDLGRWG